MKLSILYFASLADTLALKNESINIEGVQTVKQLKLKLAERGDTWQEQMNNPQIRCAVNQSLATADTPLSENAEIAFFPPVTGG